MWEQMDEKLVEDIKNMLLGLLGTSEKKSIKNAAICLAIIAAEEIPRGKWDSFLQTMSQNATNEVYSHRLAAVMAVGYLSEFLPSDCLR